MTHVEVTQLLEALEGNVDVLYGVDILIKIRNIA